MNGDAYSFYCKEKFWERCDLSNLIRVELPKEKRGEKGKTEPGTVYKCKVCGGFYKRQYSAIDYPSGLFDTEAGLVISDKYFKIEQPQWNGLGSSGNPPLTLAEARLYGYAGDDYTWKNGRCNFNLQDVERTCRGMDLRFVAYVSPDRTAHNSDQFYKCRRCGEWYLFKNLPNYSEALLKPTNELFPIDEARKFGYTEAKTHPDTKNKSSIAAISTELKKPAISTELKKPQPDEGLMETPESIAKKKAPFTRSIREKNAVFDSSNSAWHLRKFSVLSLHSAGRMRKLESWLNHETPDAEFTEYGYGIIERHLAAAGLRFARHWYDAHTPTWGTFGRHAASYIFYHTVQDARRESLARAIFEELFDFALTNAKGKDAQRIFPILFGFAKDYMLPDRIESLLPGEVKAHLPRIKEFLADKKTEDIRWEEEMLRREGWVFYD